MDVQGTVFEHVTWGQGESRVKSVQIPLEVLIQLSYLLVHGRGYATRSDRKWYLQITKLLSTRRNVVCLTQFLDNKNQTNLIFSFSLSKTTQSGVGYLIRSRDISVRGFVIAFPVSAGFGKK